ncbi:hypothetical protein [Oryzomonas rubra]|uniref:Uncharacterized protein n=1 Tax=Oryzomonas rubra TaxID=2509454 RepID=A0A5A9X5M2_9BACT|nr:hypothetical protein [Oryzomonas rubra]KAA0888084.1 hypothetical protein ET418_16930 [Oryzomonas rubra]
MKTIISTIAIIAAMAAFTAPAMAQLQVYDYSLEMQKRVPKSISLVNSENGSGEVTVKITVIPDKSTPYPDGTPDCSKSLKVFPRVLKIKEGEESVVKFLAPEVGACRITIESIYSHPAPAPASAQVPTSAPAPAPALANLPAPKQSQASITFGLGTNIPVRVDIKRPPQALIDRVFAERAAQAAKTAEEAEKAAKTATPAAK